MAEVLHRSKDGEELPVVSGIAALSIGKFPREKAEWHHLRRVLLRELVQSRANCNVGCVGCQHYLLLRIGVS